MKRESHNSLAAFPSDRYVCLIGAQKAGTTSLYHYLAEHPAVHAVRWKEGKLFLRNPPLPADVQRFKQLTKERTSDQWLFETSTYYTKHPRYTGVPDNIRRTFPNAKLIYLVRDPVQRIWSQYSHYLAKGWEHRPFLEALEHNPDYCDFSRYRMQLDQYLKVFSADQIKVVVFEEFIRDKHRIMTELFDYLGIDSAFVTPNLNTVYNDADSKQAMTTSLRLTRSLPGYRNLPWGLRKRLSRALGRPLPKKSDHFTKDVQRAVFERIESDTIQFLDFLGRDVPDWSCLRPNEVVHE